MSGSSYKNLEVFRLAEDLVDRVWSITVAWDWLARDTVGRQLVRSADSIGANIAEGAGRGSYQDNRRFVTIARGSLQETQYWLRRAFKRSLLSAEEVDSIKPVIDELAPRLNAYLNSIPKKRRPTRKQTGNK